MSTHAQKTNRSRRASKRAAPEQTSQRTVETIASRLAADAGLLEDTSQVTPRHIQALQRTVGNQATTRFIQAKLRVGPTNNRHEREAGRVAAKVVRAPAPRPLTTRREREDEELRLRTRSAATGAFTVSSDLERRLTYRKGNGSPLPDSTRAFMEPRFGANFGDVRVHTGREATQISRQINAKAFTHGQDIYFGAGGYQPETDAGKRLLAHELTHVVQQKGAAVIKPYVSPRASLNKDTAAKSVPIHRAPSQNVQRIFGRGKTTRKSRVYKGRPGGRESQEKVVGVISMSPQQRAAQLKRYLVDRPVKGNLNGFNVILPLLEGGSRNEVERNFTGNKTILTRIKEIFDGYRRKYLIQVFKFGEPSAKSKFALRAGLLTGTSFTFGRGSGRREHGVNKDLVAFAQTLPKKTLRVILEDTVLTKPLTKKTLRLLQAELSAKKKEKQVAKAGEGSKKLVKQVELFDAYQKQLIEMVSKRPVKFFGSRTKHKQRLTNDLQQWAQGKPRQMLDKLLLSESEFCKTLNRKYDKEDIKYIKALMRDPTSWKEKKGEQGQTLDPGEASLLQQIEALLARQTGKRKVTRFRQRGQIQAQIEQLLFGEGGPASARATVRKLYGANWRKTLGDKLQAAGLAESKTDELLTKIEHGGEAAGDIYQQLWRRVPRSTHAKWHRAKRRIRWSRTTLDLIQKLKPGTPEYGRVKNDHQLLSRIEAHSTTAHWQTIRTILGLGEEEPQGRQPNTQTWQALLNAELTSKIINRATLYRHVFNAQQAAWDYGKSQHRQAPEETPLGGLYEKHNQVPGDVRTGYNAFMNQLGEGIDIGKWWNPGEGRSRNRLKQALGMGNVAPYPQRLQVGDLLNAAKKTGGKRRTKQELIELAIEGLSGQALLDQWVVLDRTNLIFKVKADLWGTPKKSEEHNKDQKGFADLVKRPERVKMERALLERVAKEALQADRSKEEAADAMVAAGQMQEAQRDPDAAIRYVAQRTLAIAGLEGAQQLSKGKQWSRFSTRSLIYKEAQAEYLGKLRSTHTDLKTGTGEEKQQKLSQGTQSLEEAEKTLKSEEAAFKALRAKYNRRLKTIVTVITATLLGTLGLVFTGGLSAGPLMAGLWAALSAVISKGISTLVDYTNEGNVVITDTFRELFVDTVISFIGGIMGNVNLAVRSMGAEALYGKSASVGAKLFGKPGLGILASWAQKMSTTVAGAPVHAIDRLLQSSSVTSAWQKSRENFAEKFKSLPEKTLQSYAKGFLTQAVVVGIVETGGKKLLPSVDHPALEKLDTSSRKTFEEHKAIRPFEFDSWDSFWESIVEGSQVNTTDYGKSFIVYKKGLPKGWEVDTSVLTSDTGPQSLINAYKAMGFSVVMGSVKKGVGKTLSSLGPSKEPTLTERKGEGAQPGGYEALGELSSGKMQKLNTLDPNNRAKLIGLPVGHLQALDAEKLIQLAEVLNANQLAKLAVLSEAKVTDLGATTLIRLARERAFSEEVFRKLNQLATRHLTLSSASLIKLTNYFQPTQLAAFATQHLDKGTLIRFLGLPAATLQKFAPFEAQKIAHLLRHFTKEDLVVLASFDETRFDLLKALPRNRLTELSQLSRDELNALTAHDLGGNED